MGEHKTEEKVDLNEKIRERTHHLRKAQAAFVRAAAALTEHPSPDDDGFAFALLEGAIAISALAKADPDGRAKARVDSWLEERKKNKEAPGVTFEL